MMRVSFILLLVPLATWVLAKRPEGENVHRPDGDCTACHTAERAVLERDPAAARALLAADLEQRCLRCHGDQGPSHRTGIRPRKPVPDTLPLSAADLITCATCHFMHGESNSWGAFVRIDNSRGGLCLTCHELAELE
jgi:predicted CXXCH cytochrome family protein